MNLQMKPGIPKFIMFLSSLFFSFTMCSAATFLNLSRKSKNQISHSDRIFILNKTAKTIDFDYANEFKELVPIHMGPFGSYSLKSKTEINLVQANKFQTLYILKPGDSLQISMSDSGNAIFNALPNSKRNYELDIFRKMNENSQFNYFELLNLYRKNIKNNYKKIDSIYCRDFEEKMKFANNYIIAYKIDSIYCKQIRDILKKNIYQLQMGVTINAKEKVDNLYIQYTDLLCLKIESQINKSDIKNSDMELLNTCFLYRHKNQKNPDSLFNYAKNEMTGALRDEIQFLITKKELEKEPQSSRWFIREFIAHCENSFYKEYINNLVENAKLSIIGDNQDNVVTALKQVKGLNSVIENLKGKVIYIDIWASWCVPCRASMPDSKKVRQRFLGKPVEFIYISIDENINFWLNAAKQEKLNEVNHNYLMLSFSKSKFKQSFKITTIPHYILLDKKGLVVSSNAPKPGDPVLFKLLNSLIN